MRRIFKTRLCALATCVLMGVGLFGPGSVSVAEAKSDSGRLTGGAVKSAANHNPLMDHKFGADPYAMTYNGRVYIYMTNDSQQFDQTTKNWQGHPNAENNYSKISTITVISSDDMVNWVDHGEIDVAGITSWAKNSWAPAACHKTINGKEKFFLYFADNGSGIGVLEADSPIGPFREPATGSRLIARGSQAANGVTWLFDPAVLVDDNGVGYLYYGGGVPNNNHNYPGTARVVRLADNMVQVSGNAVAINAPGLFEDSGIHKANNRYYYTYCSNFSNTLSSTGRGNICVMESSSPMGPFNFVGIVLSNPYTYFGIGGNNHHAFFNYNGKTYITYHSQVVTKALGYTNQGYRSTHIDPVSYDGNGHIKSITGTLTGLSQSKYFNPYTRVEAETIGWSSGITTAKTWNTGSMVSSVNTKVTEIHNGDYVAVAGVNFNSGVKSINICASTLAGGTVEVRLGGRYGTKIGEVKINGNSSWQEYTANLNNTTGVHDVYFVFTGSSSGQLFELDYWKMNSSSSGSQSNPQPTATPVPSNPTTPSNPSTGSELVSNGTIESGTTDWEGLYGCTLGLGYVTVNSGQRSLKVSNRSISSQGAMQYLTGKLQQGKTYNINAAVRYNMSENAQATGQTTFVMSIIYGDGSIQNMVSVTTAGDRWANLSGSYTVPANANLSNVRIYIETLYTANPGPQDLVTFFVDDVSIKAASSQGTTAQPTATPAPTATPRPTATPAPTATPKPNSGSANSGVLSDGWYYIKSTYAQKYLQADDNRGGNSVNVEIGTGTGVAGQKWYLTNTGDGYITLKNGHGYMLDVQYGSADDGANIQTYTANGADAQKFKLASMGNGAYGITTKASGDTKALDLYNWGSSDGTNVCQWTYYAADNQKWIFEPCGN